MRKKVILVLCLLLIGCSTPQPWVKVESGSKTQDAEVLRKALGDCHADAAGKHQMYANDVDELFGSHSTHAYFQNCMIGKGYVKG
jgi:hypothetical protein